MFERIKNKIIKIDQSLWAFGRLIKPLRVILTLIVAIVVFILICLIQEKLHLPEIIGVIFAAIAMSIIIVSTLILLIAYRIRMLDKEDKEK